MHDFFLDVDKLFQLTWFVIATKVGVILIIGFLALQAVKSVFKFLSKRTGFDNNFLRPLEKIFKTIIIIPTVFVGLSVLGIGFEGAWTFLTTLLALIAIGFIAVWSVLSNFVCAFLILILKPFNVGDEVSFPGENISGRVVDLSLAYTTIKQADGMLFRIPNNLFFQKTVACRSTDNPPKTLMEQFRSTSPANLL